MCDRVGFVVGHFHVWVVGGCAVGFGVGCGRGVGCGLFLAFTGLAFLVFCGGFFKEGFAVALDCFFVFVADRGWIGDAPVFVVAFDKFLCGLGYVRLL